MTEGTERYSPLQILLQNLDKAAADWVRAGAPVVSAQLTETARALDESVARAMAETGESIAAAVARIRAGYSPPQ